MLLITGHVIADEGEGETPLVIGLCINICLCDFSLVHIDPSNVKNLEESLVNKHTHTPEQQKHLKEGYCIAKAFHI